MKRVKFMLSAILVMAVVAAGLAFEVKNPNICAYSTTVAEDRNVCPTVFPGCTIRRTALATNTWATTFACTLGEDCPLTTVCLPSKSITVEP